MTAVTASNVSHVKVMASLALECAVTKDWAKAYDVLGDIVQTYAWPGIYAALLIWSNQLVDAMDPADLDGNDVRVTVLGDDWSVTMIGEIDDETLTVPGQAEVRPDMEWASKFMLAAAKGDRDRQRSLFFDAAHSDRMHSMTCTMTMLNLAGTTIGRLRAAKR